MMNKIKWKDPALCRDNAPTCRISAARYMGSQREIVLSHWHWAKSFISIAYRYNEAQCPSHWTFRHAFICNRPGTVFRILTSIWAKELVSKKHVFFDRIDWDFFDVENFPDFSINPVPMGLWGVNNIGKVYHDNNLEVSHLTVVPDNS